jgi:hypothetical protein
MLPPLLRGAALLRAGLADAWRSAAVRAVQRSSLLATTAALASAYAGALLLLLPLRLVLALATSLAALAPTSLGAHEMLLALDDRLSARAVLLALLWLVPVVALAALRALAPNTADRIFFLALEARHADLARAIQQRPLRPAPPCCRAAAHTLRVVAASLSLSLLAPLPLVGWLVAPAHLSLLLWRGRGRGAARAIAALWLAAALAPAWSRLGELVVWLLQLRLAARAVAQELLRPLLARRAQGGGEEGEDVRDKEEEEEEEAERVLWRSDREWLTLGFCAPAALALATPLVGLAAWPLLQAAAARLAQHLEAPPRSELAL